MTDADGNDARVWRTFGERVIYDDAWVWLGQIDVELPSGERYWHHVVRLHRAAMMVLLDEQDRVLLLWRILVANSRLAGRGARFGLC